MNWVQRNLAGTAVVVALASCGASAQTTATPNAANGSPSATPSAFTFRIPSGWTLAGDTSATTAHLVLGRVASSPASIVIGPDVGPGATDGVPTTTIAGKTAYVLVDTSAGEQGSGGFQRITDVQVNGTWYQVACLGSATVRTATLLSACHAVEQSLRFR